jgi:hypothetical protein
LGLLQPDVLDLADGPAVLVDDLGAEQLTQPHRRSGELADQLRPPLAAAGVQPLGRHPQPDGAADLLDLLEGHPGGSVRGRASSRG